MTRRGELTSCQPQPTGAFIAVPAARPFGGAQSSWRRTLSAIVAAGGCALFAAMAVGPDAQAQIQASRSRQLQGDPRVPLQSLHPIVEQVLPAVVNVSVAIKEAEEGELAAPDENDKALPTSPFEEFLHRYFGGRSASVAVSPGRAARPRAGCARLRLHHRSRRLCRHQQPRRRRGDRHQRDPDDRPVSRQADRHRHQDRSRAAQDRRLARPAARELRQFATRSASATGCWRSAIPSASAARSPPASSRRAAATSHSGPFDDFLQIDASINQGNSGGPTFNIAGEVIGINTAIFSPNGGSVGIGFAIPSNLAKPSSTSSSPWHRRARLARRQASRADAGHRRGPGSRQAAGALVSDVMADSPAAKAGVRQGDVILPSRARRSPPHDLSLPSRPPRSAGSFADGVAGRQGARAPSRDRPHAAERRNRARRRAVEGPLPHEHGALGLSSRRSPTKPGRSSTSRATFTAW